MISIPDRFRTRRWAVVAGVALLLTGGLAGAAVTRAYAPVAVMAPGAPVTIAALKNQTAPLAGVRVATVKGTVADVFGRQFVLTDATGKLLIDAGRRGGTALVATGETVTVQGAVRGGALQARYLVGADGQVTMLGGRRGDGGKRHGGRHGPRSEDRAAPPVPAAVPPAAPATPRP